MKDSACVAIVSNALIAMVLCPMAISGARGDGLDLKLKWWRIGSAPDLQKMEAKDIEKIQIFRLNWPKGVVDPRRREELAQKFYTERPLTRNEDAKTIESLLGILRLARPPKAPDPAIHHRSDKPGSPNRVLVVQPAKGEPFEIPYNSGFHAPFDGLESLELKEALFALEGGRTRFTIIHFDKGEVQQVIHHQAIAPHTGGVYSRTVTGEMHLLPKQALTLYVKVRDGRKTLMEDEKPMHYGCAKVYNSSGPGSYIVLLEEP